MIQKKFKVDPIILGSAFVLIGILVVFPFTLLFMNSFKSDGVFTLQNYATVFSASRNYTALLNSLKLGFLTSLFAVLMGAPLAWLVTRTNLPFAKLFKTLFILPYMIPPFVGAIAWSQLLNRRNGYVNRWIMSLFGLDRYVFNVNTLSGLVWVMALYLYPFVFITVVGALERMDPTLEEAARTCGSKTLRIMKDITLPLVAPSIAGGALLVFASSIANFGIPALIGMQGRVFVLTTMIYSYMHSGGFNGIAMASSLSVLLMGVSVGALLINNLYLKKKQYTLISGKSMRPTTLDLRAWKLPCLVLAAIVVFVTVILPFFSIALTSLLDAWGADITWENISLRNYRYILFEYKLTKDALKNSLLLAISAATISMILGSLIAYISVKTKIRGRKALETVAQIPYTIPGTVVAIAMILAWSGRYGINLYNTFWILLVAYVAHYTAFAIRTTSASLEQIHSSLEEAARISGGSWLKSLRDIVIPLIRPGLVAGWFLIFMPALRELTMSILLWGPKTVTIGVAVFEMQEAGYVQISAAFATLLLIIVITGNLIVKWLTKGKIGI
ncbi:MULTISPECIES: iron ABC transporter permease [unclassified Mesotoga]|uniref:ABC transporter permease n=1 Tax=unclassified Mesotoga TaxID=1184398 RepID=UPI000C1888B9|nr:MULTISPECIES: iron ABC transporter permease [unclassified Mesotoga]PVD17115.1 AfuB [Mesotoga sp. Brook.08.105.5.1]